METGVCLSANLCLFDSALPSALSAPWARWNGGRGGVACEPDFFCAALVHSMLQGRGMWRGGEHGLYHGP